MIDKAKNAFDSLARLSRSTSFGASSSSSRARSLSASSNSATSKYIFHSSYILLYLIVDENCSRALQTVRDLRQRYASEEHSKNFSPYPKKGKDKRPRVTTWTLRAVCVSSRQQCRVPAEVKYKERLVEAGLGEKKILVPDIDCSASDFKELVIHTFPKLRDAGGFELLRCLSNSRSLEVISGTVSRLPRLLKAVIGSGRVYIRPIQRDLNLKPELESANIEVNFFVVPFCLINSLFYYRKLKYALTVK